MKKSKYVRMLCGICAVGMMLLTACNNQNGPEEGINGGSGDNTEENTGGDDVLPTVPAVEGALSGVFSIGKDRQVRFSQGNLQYQQSTGVWSFAAHQYEVVGEGNLSGSSWADKIDLFTWSNNGANIRYGVGIDWGNDDYNEEFVEWGNNAIINGGNQSDFWRTLTKEEWEYLLEGRPNADVLQGITVLNGVGGWVLLPDEWKAPKGLSFVAGGAPATNGDTYKPEGYALTQTYTREDWEKMEAAGALFLPAAGYMDRGPKLVHSGYNCKYWCATPDYDFSPQYFACMVFGIPSYIYVDSGSQSNAVSVRLVMDVE